MALYLIRYLWENAVTGESRDRVVWGFNVEAAAAPAVDDAMTAIEGAFATVVNSIDRLNNAYQLTQCQVYDVVEGGAPVDEALFVAPLLQSGGGAGPHEVQVCVSRWVLDGLGRPFKKGRMYWGPISGTLMGTARPTAGLQQEILDWTEKLHTNYEFLSWTPVVDTKAALHVPLEIVQYSTDDAWDTQRRRGVDPTTDLIKVPVSA